VANEIGIVNAVKRAGTVRVIFVFSKTNAGARFERVTKLFKAVTACAENIADHSQCLRFIWNGFSKAELEGEDAFVPSMIRLLLDRPNAEYSSNQAVLDLLEEANKQINPKRPSQSNPVGARGIDLLKHIGSTGAGDTDEVKPDYFIAIAQKIACYRIETQPNHCLPHPRFNTIGASAAAGLHCGQGQERINGSAWRGIQVCCIA